MSVARSALRFLPRSVPALLLVVGYTAVWCVLWGEVSLANVVSGLVLATVSIALLGGNDPSPASIRPVAMIRFLAIVAVDLVKSTIAVALEVVTPGDATDEVIIVVDVGPDPIAHPLLMTVAITITPGTGVVDVDQDAGTLYLHLLHGARSSDTADHVRRLNRLANEALPMRADPAPGLQPAHDPTEVSP